MKKIVLIYLFGVLFFCVKAQISIRLSTNKITIGQPIKFSIFIKKQNKDSLKIYPLDTLPNFNIINIKERSFNDITAKEIEFTSFEKGNYVLPSFSVVINKNTYNTPPQKISVLDVKLDPTKQQLFDIKTIMPVSYSLWNYTQKNWIIGAVIYLLGVLAFIIYLLYRKEKETDNQIYKDLISPYDEAIIGLNKLKKYNIIQKEDATQLYVSLSIIAKRFIGRKYKINYAERLTEEFVEEIEENNILPKEQNKILNDFLSLADLVKFAKYQPTDSVKTNNFNQILTLIEAHKPLYNLNESNNV